MIDVIIVNWNSGFFLQKCLQSIFDTPNKNFIHKVYIIDNDSDDLSMQEIESNDRIEIIWNKENRGFAKACNQGFKLSTAEYILLLNPDTQLLSTTLQDCITFINKKDDVDILGCQLLNDNGKVVASCSKFPTALGILRDATGLSKIAPSIFKPGIIMRDWEHEESRFVDQVMGAFMFMRKSIFEKVGYFDERFFVYYEEVDFSKRLSELGGKSFFNAEIKAIHSGEGRGYSVKAFRLFLNLRSRLQYAKKHFTFLGYYCVWICTFFVEPLTRSTFLLLSGKKNEIADLFKGYKLLLNK
ncbi:MAG TPA: glycosyltransferase family 2 protein [Hanamia sp.]|jgi:GT2 family glycosyltransferase|nr:glycosyltransferase family 2 protein [Hanamia sp.]